MGNNIDDLIKKKITAMHTADVDFLKGIEQKQNGVYNSLLKFLNKFSTKAGYIDKKDLSNKKILTKLNKELIGFINVSTFKSDVSKYLKVFDQVETMSKKILSMENKIDLSDFNLNIEKQLAIEDITAGLMNKEMLKANLINPTKKILYRHVTTGISMKDARKEIKDFLIGTGKLGQFERYTRNITQEALSRYDGMINQKVVNEFKLDAFSIVGSLIVTSMPVCVNMIHESGSFKKLAVNGKYAVSDIPKIISIIRTKPGFVKGTNPNNYFINRNHWGCRHQFIPTRFTEKDKKMMI